MTLHPNTLKRIVGAVVVATALALTFEFLRGANAHSVAVIIGGVAAIWHPKTQTPVANEIESILEPMAKQIVETFTVSNPLNGQVVTWSKTQVLPDAADGILNVAALFGLKQKINGTYDVEITDVAA